MLKSYLQLLMSQTHLNREQAESAMSLILEGADPHQTAAFLAVLRYRTETPDELAGMFSALQKQARLIELPGPVLDIVGTGGDFAGTVNISTGSAILAAACGIPVAKHGNRSVSSRSGSADVLEALGVNIECDPVEAFKRANMAFFYAPTFHPSLKKLAPVRRGLKLPTVFNMLCPLLNPAKAVYSLIGVAHESMLELMSQTLLLLGTQKRALVFHGSGLDELTPVGPSSGYEICEGRMTRFEFDPEELGFERCALSDLQGGDAAENAAILLNAFAGNPSPVADALIFNAGAAIWIYGKASTLKEGIAEARRVQRSGKALETLEKLKGDYLDRIVVRKKEEIKGQIRPSGRFAAALKEPGLSVIAEVKRRSPSRGAIATEANPVECALGYSAGGASAISVLTDFEGFGGTIDDLKQVAHALPSMPTLRKDFVIHPVQLAEARLAGADAVLLIAKVLGKDLKRFLDEATSLGLEVLTEVHNEKELQLALEAGATIIGVNNRNLQTFQVDLNTSRTLRPLIPKGVIAVAESGIQTQEQAKQMRDLGYDAILVGEALMRTPELLQEMRGVL